MDLAEAAPTVSAVAAAHAPAVAGAAAEPAIPHKPPDVKPAPSTEPAETMDDPHKHAPPPAENVNKKPGGASVEALRGTSGVLFESQAAVLRGVQKSFLRRCLPIIFDERDFVAYGEALRFVLIKGDNIFVFTEETDVAPLFSIPLQGLKSMIEDPNKPDKYSSTISPTGKNMSKSDMVTVLLKYPTGKIAYQFTLNKHNDEGIAQRFVDAIKKSGTMTGDKTASVVYAEAVAKDAKKAQPEEPNNKFMKFTK